MDFVADIKKANTSKARVITRNAIEPKVIETKKAKNAPFEWVPTKKRRLSDRLFTNTLVATALLLCVTMARVAVDDPKAQSVFQTIQENVTLNLDESLGKLSFVSNFLPETALVFWNDSQSQTILSPVEGDIVHVWNAQEPYISMKSQVLDVRSAADGEVMSIAHGNDEEVILRVRHANGLETLYGNLQSCYVEEGDAVYKGDLIGRAMDDGEVFFELRQDGRAIDPTYSMISAIEANP